jgi:single-stranded DNA-binding protein
MDSIVGNCGFDPQMGQTKENNIDICCFSAGLRSKSK